MKRKRLHVRRSRDGAVQELQLDVKGEWTGEKGKARGRVGRRAIRVGVRGGALTQVALTDVRAVAWPCACGRNETWDERELQYAVINADMVRE